VTAYRLGTFDPDRQGADRGPPERFARRYSLLN
jgi:hypothetical protein